MAIVYKTIHPKNYRMGTFELTFIMPIAKDKYIGETSQNTIDIGNSNLSIEVQMALQTC